VHTVAARSAPAAGNRNLHLDNARGLLIILVVAAHLLESLMETSSLARTTYAFVYSFHIPAFVVVSGYLSRSDLTWPRFRALVLSIILPYLILELLYTGVDYVVFSRSRFAPTLLTPYWLLWYLPSLFMWRLALPVLSRLKYPLLTAALVAVLAGVFPQVGMWMSLSRTLVFLPFFVLGSVLARNGRATAFVHPVIAVTVILTGALIALFVASDLDVRWLYGSQSYSRLVTGPAAGIAFRAILLLWAAAMALAFLSLVPGHSSFVTRIGARSAYPYLLHGLVIMIVVRHIPDEPGLLTLGAMMVGAVALATALSSGTAIRCTWLAVEPASGRWDVVRSWLGRRPESESTVEMLK
jgi:fucose 4-O-acetylase-like acetyltransferase